jgi:hypothetical protein
MNTVKLGYGFEKEAFEILKNKFDKVIWLSKKKKSSIDFKCIKEGKEYLGEAKVNNNSNSITLRDNQKDVDFLIVKVKGKIYFLFKEEFFKSPFKILIEKNKHNLNIEEDIWRNLCQLKLDLKLRTFDEVLNYLLKLEDKK